MDETATKPKIKRRSLKRDVRIFVASVVGAIHQQDGINEDLTLRGWNIDDPIVGECIRAELQRIVHTLESVQR